MTLRFLGRIFSRIFGRLFFGAMERRPNEPSVSRCFLSVLTIGLIVLAPFFPASAQSEGGGGRDPRQSNDIFFNVGTLLPSRNGLTENVPGWGLRYSTPTSKGLFEFGANSWVGNGIAYRSGTVDYRLDFSLEGLNAIFLLGVHGDQYTSASTSSKVGGGWHYGGGFTMDLAGPFLLRFDFRQRFSPGTSVEVMVGFVLRMGASGS